MKVIYVEEWAKGDTLISVQFFGMLFFYTMIKTRFVRGQWLYKAVCEPIAKPADDFVTCRRALIRDGFKKVAEGTINKMQQGKP